MHNIPKEGTLRYDPVNNFYYIEFDDGGDYPELQSGDTLEVQDGVWYEQTIAREESLGWVLLDYDRVVMDEDDDLPLCLEGLRVRINVESL